MKNALLVAIIAALLIAPMPHTVKAQESSTALVYPITGETMDILYGENLAVGVVAVRMGGTVDLGIDFSLPEFSRMSVMVLSIGIGSSWALYLHKPLWEIPPGIFLLLSYTLAPGYDYDAAIADAFKAAKRVGEALGVKFHPMFEQVERGEQAVIFYAPIDREAFINFFKEKFTAYYGGKGLLSLIKRDRT